MHRRSTAPLTLSLTLQGGAPMQNTVVVSDYEYLSLIGALIPRDVARGRTREGGGA